jgi:hypothetical protein
MVGNACSDPCSAGAAAPRRWPARVAILRSCAVVKVLAIACHCCCCSPPSINACATPTHKNPVTELCEKSTRPRRHQSARGTHADHVLRLELSAAPRSTVSTLQSHITHHPCFPTTPLTQASPLRYISPTLHLSHASHPKRRSTAHQHWHCNSYGKNYAINGKQKKLYTELNLSGMSANLEFSSYQQ